MQATAVRFAATCARARVSRRAHGQAGYTLIEIVIAVAIAGLLVMSLAGAMLLVVRTGAHTSNRQLVDTGTGSFAESLHSMDYLECDAAPGGRPDYDAAYAAWPESWEPPSGMSASVVAVEHWDGGRYVADCAGQDRGAQRLTLRVSWEGLERQAQIVKRRR